MTLEELLAALATTNDGKQYVDAINAIVSRFQDKVTKKNNEAKNLRTRAKTAEVTLKTVMENHSKVLSHLGIDDDVEDLDAALEVAIKPGKKDGGYKALLKRIEKIENERKVEKTNDEALVAAEKGKRHAMQSQAPIIAALTAGKAVKRAKLVALFPCSSPAVKKPKDRYSCLEFLWDKEAGLILYKPTKGDLTPWLGYGSVVMTGTQVMPMENFLSYKAKAAKFWSDGKMRFYMI